MQGGDERAGIAQRCVANCNAQAVLLANEWSVGLPVVQALSIYALLYRSRKGTVMLCASLWAINRSVIGQCRTKRDPER